MVRRGLLLAATCCALLFQPFATQLVFENEIGDDTVEKCSQRLRLIEQANNKTKFEFPPSLTGKWVSERCETRLGPEYLLRSYTFYPNGSLQMVQFFYNDESCSSIKYTIATLGTYRIKSRPPSPAPTRLAYDLSRVSIVAHDTSVLQDLLATINNECPDVINTPWRPLTEYVIFVQPSRKRQTAQNVMPHNNFDSSQYTNAIRAHHKYSQESDVDFQCLLSMFRVSFEELQTVRVRTRTLADGYRHELLLAKTHPYQGGRQPLLSTFQLPLVLVNETRYCYVCNIVSRSTNMFVHPLNAKPRLRPSLNGEWISDTCEERSWSMPHTGPSFGAIDERPSQIFAMRSFRVNENLERWELETKYYSNYLCTSLIMVHQSYGQYDYKGQFSNTVGGAVNIDFQVEKSYLLILKESGLRWVRMEPTCYPNYWEVGVKMEVPSRYACTNIGITSLPIKYNIAKLDTDNEGNYILYLGDDDTNVERPTSFEYPLVQCTSTPYHFAADVDSAARGRPSVCAMSLIAVAWLAISR